MLLPPCRPLLPAVLPNRHRRSSAAEVSRAHSPPGLRLNLNWAVDLLAAAPGPHQQRIARRAAEEGQASSSFVHAVTRQDAYPSGGISKEELGRSTWTLLHTLAAQWPPRPTRQQQRDLDMLVSVLTRIYPCYDCATHFKEVVKQNPPRAGSRQQLEQWMCEVHNSVNKSLGKPLFNCRAAGLRWKSVDCDSEEACALPNANGR